MSTSTLEKSHQVPRPPAIAPVKMHPANRAAMELEGEEALFALLGALHAAQFELRGGETSDHALGYLSRNNPETLAALEACLQQAEGALDAAAWLLNERIRWPVLEAHHSPETLEAIPACVRAAPQEVPAVRAERCASMRRFFAVARGCNLCCEADAARAMRRALAKFLGKPVRSRAHITAAQWERAADAVADHELSW